MAISIINVPVADWKKFSSSDDRIQDACLWLLRGDSIGISAYYGVIIGPVWYHCEGVNDGSGSFSRGSSGSGVTGIRLV